MQFIGALQIEPKNNNLKITSWAMGLNVGTHQSEKESKEEGAKFRMLKNKCQASKKEGKSQSCDQGM